MTSGEDFTADIVTESDQALDLILLEESANRTEGNLVTEDKAMMFLSKDYSEQNLKTQKKIFLFIKVQRKLLKLT